jgi:hypothetical protein
MKRRAKKRRAKQVSDGLEHVRITDRNFWQEYNLELDPWLEALEDIDQGRGTAALIKLLKGKEPIPRDLIADLLKRYNLTRKRGGQSTPEYDLSHRDRRLLLAMMEIRRYCDSGMKLDAAVERVAAAHRIDAEVLYDELLHRRLKMPPR